MDKARISYLYNRYLNDSLNAEELAELKQILTDPLFQAELDQLIDQDWEQLNSDQWLKLPEQKLLAHFDSIIASEQRRTKPESRLWVKWIAAAAVVFVIFGAGLFYFNGHREANSESITNDIAPGKIGATLTLDNGKKIRLSEAVNGELAKESGVVITKTAAGQLAYEIKDQDLAEANKINTLSTAKGETYQVKLPDGTFIWLNSASTLKYPTSFANLKFRNVELSGEAYFEVAKDKAHPFIVESKGQQVEVLGTHFNISAYKEEPAIKTTLVEGSVKVTVNHKERLLKPNQQAIFKGNSLEVSDIDAEYAMAWKNGYFLFNVETLESIMIKIGRWYNVKVEYADPALKSKTFVGTISRFEKVSKVLNMLERAGGVIFSVEGDKIIIDKKK